MEYLIPVISVSAAFIASLLCLIFSCSKRFLLWLFPLILSFSVLFCDLVFLNSLANSLLVSVNADILDYSSVFLLTISILLLLCAVFIRIFSNPEDSRKRRSNRSKAEAKYVSVGKAKEKS